MQNQPVLDQPARTSQARITRARIATQMAHSRITRHRITQGRIAQEMSRLRAGLARRSRRVSRPRRRAQDACCRIAVEPPDRLPVAGSFRRGRRPSAVDEQEQRRLVLDRLADRVSSQDTAVPARASASTGRHRTRTGAGRGARANGRQAAEPIRLGAESLRPQPERAIYPDCVRARHEPARPRRPRRTLAHLHRTQPPASHGRARAA